MQGLIHIYTGEGKGKTTAALGLTLRAAGYGKRIILLQFLKGGRSGELNALRSLPNITVLRNSREFGFYQYLSEADRAAVRRENTENLQEALWLVEAGLCDMLVLDEAMAAYNLDAVDRPLLDTLVRNKKEGLELVLTGRDAPKHLLDAAHYVSEITPKKHPYDEGVAAREGIEY